MGGHETAQNEPKVAQSVPSMKLKEDKQNTKQTNDQRETQNIMHNAEEKRPLMIKVLHPVATQIGIVVMMR